MSETPCPHCGEPVDPRQLVCTNCGGRVALRERSPFGREPLPAAAVVLIAVAAIGALIGLGPRGADAIAFFAVIACCVWAIWRVWRREHRYG